MKKLSTALLIVLAAAVGALASHAFFKPTTPAAAAEISALDTREVVPFNDEQTHYALTQMRGFLETLILMDNAEFADDFQEIAAVAAVQGPGQGSGHPDGFHDAMPDGFRAMTKQMRQGFGQAAKAAQAGDLEAYIEAKQQAQNTCIACHASYRFQPQN